MNKIVNSIEKVSRFINILSGIGIVAAMAMVVLNVILRAIFKSPILGTYEYTGFLTAMVVSLGLAHCAVLDGHISIDFLMEKLGAGIQKFVYTVTNIFALGFIGVFTFEIFEYAGKLMRKGEVSPTTQTPYYLFIFITAIGFLALSLVIATRIYKVLKGGTGK